VSRYPLASLLLALLLSLTSGCGPGPPEISQQELRRQLESGSPPQVLDVRTAAEFESGHVPGALNVPHTELAGRLDGLGLEPERELVVYCERGGRARAAIAILEESGFRDVRHLDGDMKAWRAADLPCTGC
jgi:phage shock protein E